MEQKHPDPPVIALHRQGAWESSSALLYTIDRGFRIVATNSAWDRFARTHSGSLPLHKHVPGANLLDVLPQDERPLWEETCKRIFQGELPRHEVEQNFIGPRGACVIRVTVTPLQDGSEIHGATFTGHDVTEYQKLRDEIDRYRAESAALAVEMHRLQQVALQFTPDRDPGAALRLIVQAAGAALPQARIGVLLVEAQSGLVTPFESGVAAPLALEAVADVATPLIQRLRTGPTQFDPVGYDDVAQGGDGPGSVHGLWIQPLRGHSGCLLGCLVCGWTEPHGLSALEHQVLHVYAAFGALAIENDRLYRAAVQARQKAEQLQQTTDDRYAKLEGTLGALHDGVAVCDEAGEVVLCNPALSRVLGTDVVTAATTIRDIIQTSRLPGDFSDLGLRRALEGMPFEGECFIDLPDGIHYLNVSAQAFHGAVGKVMGAAAVVSDRTQQRQAERMKNDFLSVAAHELKTPVTTMKGYAQLALKRLPDDPGLAPVNRSLQTIDAQADRITRIVGELLDLVRLQSGLLDLDLARFDLVQLIRDTVDFLQQTTGGPIVRLFGEPAAYVIGDPDRIEQVIRNMLRNVVKFSGERSGVDIMVRIDDMVEIVMVERLESERGLPHIERFEHSQAVVPGSSMMPEHLNLRLHMTQEIVARHGGRMWVDTAEGKRTRAGWALPLATRLVAPSS